MSETLPPVTMIMSLVVERYLESHDKPLPELYEACWEFEVGGFYFAMNARKEPKVGGPADGMRPEIPAYSVGIFKNGWFCGFADPFGGALMNVTEDEVIEALSGNYL